MEKSKNSSGWKIVKDFFGFGPKITTTTTTQTFTLSKSGSKKLKKEICTKISDASKNMLDEAFASNLDFAEKCNQEFECDSLSDAPESL
ncbi:MAG: hypothetical protein AAF673_02820 [Pseudomonadota bacterium]